MAIFEVGNRNPFNFQHQPIILNTQNQNTVSNFPISHQDDDTHSQTPAMIKKVPATETPTLAFSPKIAAVMAVAAKVLPLVTGTATEMGASPRMWKNAAEAERLMRNGTEYCHV